MVRRKYKKKFNYVKYKEKKIARSIAKKEQKKSIIAKAKFAEKQEQAIVAWKAKNKALAAKKAKSKSIAKTTRAADWKRLKTLVKSGVKAVKPKVKAKKKPMPPQLRKAMEARKTPAATKQVQRYPTNIADVQKIQNLRNLLTKSEQIEVDRIFSGSQRAAAMQMIRRRIKAQQMIRERDNPRLIIKRDIMTGRDRIEKEVNREAWVA